MEKDILFISVSRSKKKKLEQTNKLREGGGVPYISWFMNVYETMA